MVRWGALRAAAAAEHVHTLNVMSMRRRSLIQKGKRLLYRHADGRKCGVTLFFVPLSSHSRLWPASSSLLLWSFTSMMLNDPRSLYLTATAGPSIELARISRLHWKLAVLMEHLLLSTVAALNGRFNESLTGHHCCSLRSPCFL